MSVEWVAFIGSNHRRFVTPVPSTKLKGGLEGDLHEHVHIENNVLFPEAEFAESRMQLR
jgi:hypothetical protein